MLESLPWDKVDIRAIAVETAFLTNQKKEKLFRLLIGQDFTHLGSIARDDVFVKLQPGGSCPSNTIKEVLQRSSSRTCPFRRVPSNKRTTHCKDSWPRDFFAALKEDTLPPCLSLGRDASFWSLEEVVDTLGWKIWDWRARLTEGCSGFYVK